jgi:ubiquitin-conjugating enzyme E2 G1
MSIKRLQSELKQMSKDPNYFFSVFPVKDNFYKWDIVMIGPPDTVFEGALIKACIEFPNEYPNKAPQFKFVTSLYHPNVYPDGKVCISILHEGVDEFGYESISERWNPSQSVNSILISILSMLSSPNFESPANVDASNLWKNNYDEYKKVIYKMVATSQNE